MFKVFFFFFRPNSYIIEWQSYMLTSIIGALIITALALIAYYVLPYKRDIELRKFWITAGFAVLASLATILYISHSVPEEIVQPAYKLMFILNFMISTTILLYIAFLFSSMFPSSKMYFPRVLAIFKKLK